MISRYARDLLNIKAQGAGFSGGSFELELKIKGVSKIQFNDLKAYAQERFESTKTVTIDSFLDEDRYTKQTDGDIPSTGDIELNKYYKTTKKPLFNKELERQGTMSHNVKLTLAYEMFVPANVFNENILNSSYVRYKNRTSYKIGNVSLDMTEVDTFSPNRKEYEVELELVDDITEANITALENVYMQINNILLRSNTIMSFNSYCGGNLRMSNPNSTIKMDYGVLAKVRNLKLKDLTIDGLMNGKYTITLKADGERVVILVDQSGVWMLQSRPGNDIVERITDTPECILPLTPLVLDAEMVFTRNEEDLFIPFDIISLKGKTLIQKFPLVGDKSRMAFIEKVVKHLSSYMNITTKTYYEIGNTSKSAILSMQEVQSFAESVNYDNDGYIITPIDEGYYQHTDKIRLEQRILSDYPDICKLKPWELLTIDVVYKDSRIYVSENSGKELKVFRGSKKYPFNHQINLNHDSLRENEGAIVEIAPEIVEGVIVLKFYRTRSDKMQPNRERVADNVWNDLNNPITPDTVIGKDMKMIRDYHNCVKRMILNSIPKGYNLVDLGSGRLGDMSKWNHLHSILAIEPNEDHIEEAKRRLRNTGNNRKLNIKMIKAGGEDTDIIMENFHQFNLDNKKVAVVSMLTMSFLFSCDEVFDGFIKTLRSIAKHCEGECWFHFITVNGPSVRKIFNDKSGTIKLDIAELRYNHEEGELFINIDKTIVTDQKEWLVDIDRVVRAVTPEGVKPEFTIEQVPEPQNNVYGLTRYAFSESNLLFNSLFAFGKIKVHP